MTAIPAEEFLAPFAVLDPSEESLQDSFFRDGAGAEVSDSAGMAGILIKNNYLKISDPTELEGT